MGVQGYYDDTAEHHRLHPYEAKGASALLYSKYYMSSAAVEEICRGSVTAWSSIRMCAATDADPGRHVETQSGMWSPGNVT